LGSWIAANWPRLAWKANLVSFKLVSIMRTPVVQELAMAKYGKAPRKVGDNEISPYQGFGGKKQMQRAQSRKRRQVRRREASIWDNLAPKEMHGFLNIVLFVLFVGGLFAVFALNGRD